VTGGAVSTTGIAGLTLGGGQGWLMAKYGLAADNLQADELVTAAGEILHVDATTHPDLPNASWLHSVLWINDRRILRGPWCSRQKQRRGACVPARALASAVPDLALPPDETQLRRAPHRTPPSA
jgi:hypothetical protein